MSSEANDLKEKIKKCAETKEQKLRSYDGSALNSFGRLSKEETLHRFVFTTEKPSE